MSAIEPLEVERIDHLGVVMGTINRLGLIELIDNRLGRDSQEEISSGEAVAGMILNGLGFSHGPLYLMCQFFANKPLEHLFRPGVQASHFNRFKLGRVLDAVSTYGCSLLFSELALSICHQEGICTRYNHLDTTSFSVHGQYETPDRDASDGETPVSIEVKRGYSKDHRPDLKQVVLEMMVSQDGGVPLMVKAWDGNASDNTIFKERSQALLKQLAESKPSRCLIADSKLYSSENAPNLTQLSFITRIPNTIGEVARQVDQAWADEATWLSHGTGRFYQAYTVTHYDIKQRWLVVYTDTSWKRAVKQVDKTVLKEKQQLDKALSNLQKQSFQEPQQAVAEVEKLFKTSRFHRLDGCQLTAQPHFAQAGRPPKEAKPTTFKWQIKVTFHADPAWRQQAYQRRACYVIGSNSNLADTEIIDHYAQQEKAERGFRFLKDPLFFASAFFLKSVDRLHALVMVMTLALLVYSVAQRQIRRTLADTEDTLPNQIGIPTDTPTLRWVFQILHGIDYVRYRIGDHMQTVITGLSDLKTRVLRLFGPEVCRLYLLSP